VLAETQGFHASRALAGTLVALTLAACGAPSPTLTRLRNEASNICFLEDRRLDAIQAPSTSSGAAAFLRSGLSVLSPELSQLRGLHAPSDTATVYQAAITALAEEVRAIKYTIAALDQGLDPAIAMRDLRRALTPFESAQDGAWQALGVPACVTT
jgi:hypothetical protein